MGTQDVPMLLSSGDIQACEYHYATHLAGRARELQGAPTRVPDQRSDEVHSVDSFK
jgi:hypothetical protein